MALVTLSGTISAADLDTNFGDKLTEIYNKETSEHSTPKDWQVDARVLDLTTALSVAQRIKDFTCPDDCQLMTMGLSMFNPDATSRTAKMALTCIDFEETEVSKYLLDQTLSVSVTGASAAEHNATRTNLLTTTGTPVFLPKGLTFRLTLTREDANAGVIDSAYGFVLLRQFRRIR